MVMEASPSPQSVGREFVRQYYTLLNKVPAHLHRFYNNYSSFVHGGLDAPNRETLPVIGQKQIHNRIQQLNFRDCHAKISQVCATTGVLPSQDQPGMCNYRSAAMPRSARLELVCHVGVCAVFQVDAQATLGNGVVVQVTGELSNDGAPMRRFTQTFVLAAQSPKKYYVHNDIFRYQPAEPSPEERSPEPEPAPAPEPEPEPERERELTPPPMLREGRESRERDVREAPRAPRYSDAQQLFLGNLPHSATEEELRALFARFGPVAELRVHSKSAAPGAPRHPNYGFITYESSAHAHECLAAAVSALPSLSAPPSPPRSHVTPRASLLQPLYFPPDSQDGVKLALPPLAGARDLTYVVSGAVLVVAGASAAESPRDSPPPVHCLFAAGSRPAGRPDEPPRAEASRPAPKRGEWMRPSCLAGTRRTVIFVKTSRA
ncbi:Ras GTPase-activating protein-binding protein 2, partial [Operophtera brumata]